MDVYKRLCYVQQLSELLLKCEHSLSHHKLVSFYGYVEREISLKNQIHSLGCDAMKRKRCERCYSLMACLPVRVNNKFMAVKCANCGKTKRKKITKPFKTHYEKLLSRK